MSLQLTQGSRLLYSLSLLFFRTLWVPPRAHKNVVAVSLKVYIYNSLAL